ncbi:hypothetical protein NE865_13971 [Phthorimaea operculella]|nr:hypothetical protein NE865_13971 [Phthorimaea operculella]
MEELRVTLQNLTEKLTAQMARFEARQEPKTAFSQDYEEFKSLVHTAITNLHCQIEMVAQDVEQQEMRSRRKMLLFHGVPEVKEEDPVDVVLHLAKDHLSLQDVVRDDFSRVHRMGKPSGTKPRPLLVKFRSMDLRSKAWSSKTGLKNTGVTASEFLTKRRHDVFVSARKRFGVSNCWTRDGVIMVLESNGTRHRVTTAAQLAAIPTPDSRRSESEAPVSQAGASGSNATPSGPKSANIAAPKQAKEAKPPAAHTKVLRSTTTKKA